MTMIARVKNQSGYSLTEMLVTIAIASVIGLAIMQIFSANSKLFSAEKNTSRAVTSARIIMDELTRTTRMLGYNPSEVSGGKYWLYWVNGDCTASSSLSFTSATILTNTAFFFTRDWNGNGAAVADYNTYERVGFCFDSTNSILKMATIDATTGKINGWVNKYRNVTAFTVDYIYDDGYTSATAGLPNPAAAVYNYKAVAAVVISLTARSEKKHEAASGLYSTSGGYFTETVSSTIGLRNMYY